MFTLLIHHINKEKRNEHEKEPANKRHAGLINVHVPFKLLPLCSIDVHVHLNHGYYILHGLETFP